MLFSSVRRFDRAVFETRMSRSETNGKLGKKWSDFLLVVANKQEGKGKTRVQRFDGISHFGVSYKKSDQ